MFTRSIPRFLLQAGILIGAASIAAVLHLGAAAIVLVMAAAFALVAAGEWLVQRKGAEAVEATPPRDAAARSRRVRAAAPASPAPSTAPPTALATTPSKTLGLPPPAVAAEPEIRPAPVWPGVAERVGGIEPTIGP